MKFWHSSAIVSLLLAEQQREPLLVELERDPARLFECPSCGTKAFETMAAHWSSMQLTRVCAILIHRLWVRRRHGIGVSAGAARHAKTKVRSFH
ncbi:MAG TPA: hypothetical protein VFB54_05255 [Burkholderiales bacterium]|nr:hypothetical protein [Burkholderiales bacterium]